MIRHRTRRIGVLASAILAALAVPAAASAATQSVWHMDETSGTTMYDSAGTNNGTLKNVGLGAPGLLGTAYSFNGSSSIVSVPSSSTLNPGAAPFSMTVHVRFTAIPTSAIGGDYDVIRKGLSGTAGGFYKLELLPVSNGTMVKAHCSMKGSITSKSLTKGPNLADGQWHAVGCAKTDTTESVVVDGVTYATSVTLGSISNSKSLTIGAKSSGGDWYDGLLDEVSYGSA